MSEERVAVYIDGFNLYHGLKHKGWQRYYWLDLEQFAKNLIRPNQQLRAVRYFTASVIPTVGDPGKPGRQATFLEALQTHSDISIHYGYFLPKKLKCPVCGIVRQSFEEKMTDVNISVALLNDAQDDLFDVAMIISADSDLVGPIQSILDRYRNKRVIVAFPPRRQSKHLRQIVSAAITIGRDKLRDSQLPDEVVRDDGFVLRRPVTWA